jgi:hypothetical protein
MLRKILLSLLILVSVITILPFAESAAHGIRQSVMQRRHHRHHSRRWWRRHRRLRRAAQAHRKSPLVTGVPATIKAASTPSPVLSQLPNGWSALPSAANGVMRFRASATGTSDQAALTVVALSQPNPAYLAPKERKQMLGGVSFAELRRIVIDKMFTSGGWVNNDYEREVGGHRVFIVTAQTPANGPSSDKIWNSYFTEVNGRIYNLTTESSLQSSERMAGEAEKFISSLR